MNSPDDEDAALSRVLLEPFGLEINEYTQKLKRNLLFFSFLSLVFVICDLEIIDDGRIFGFPIKGFSSTEIESILLLLCTYCTLHFLLASREQFGEWRLRSTGTRVFQKDIMNNYSDHVEDKRQATISSYFAANLEKWQEIRIQTEELKSTIEAHKKSIESDPRSIHQSPFIESIHGKFDEKDRYFRRIEHSLMKYEKQFKEFQFIQSFRWVVFDFALPVLIGLISIGFLIWRLIE